MPVPPHAKYLIIGAGVHGLSAAYHLALGLKTRRRGSGADILVVDKKGVAAGASGIACGVIRNNYYQPAMRALMAHSVEVWESDPEAFSYHPVGYMQISPEGMRQDVASIARQQGEIGYTSEFIEGEADCLKYMKGLFHDWQARGITSVLHEKKGGYANNRASMEGLAAKAHSQGVRITTGVRVTGFRYAGDAVSAVVTDQGVIQTDCVVVGAGPWIKTLWDMLDLPKTVSIQGRDGKMHPNIRMWTYWRLEEGTLGVDPDFQKTNDGRMPPVLHVDTDAPLYSDIDGSLITDKLWGIYYKPDFCFGGVQGGGMPYKIETDPDEVRVDPYGPEASELVGIPDPETFVQLPWDRRVARVFCTLFRNREEETDAGAFLTSDCRGNLRRIHEEFSKAHRGLHLRHGAEPEMIWFKKGPDGKPAGGYSKPYCYHIDQFESLRPVVQKVIEYARAMGIDMIQGDHEDSPGQLELNFMFDEALRTCDRLTTYRQICAQVAREFDLIACFMCKPFMGVSASGCHHNISLWRGGEDAVNPLKQDPLPGLEGPFTYRRGGENAFLPLPDQAKPGPVGLNCIGGIIDHLSALTAIGCSTVNSYRRLWDTGFWAPVYADWGYQNRTCGLRVSAKGRFEYRAVDAMVNPYLMASALLRTFDDGIRRNLDPGEPEQRNIYQALEEGKQVKKLPMSLGEALDRLEQDEVVKSALPGEMYRVFTHYKRDEWERFLATVTEWDLENYLDCLP